MKFYQYIGISFVFVFLIYHSASAIRATKEPIVVRQPDGTTLTIRLWGDEYQKSRTTLDGFLLTKNTQGYYIYDTSRAGSLVNSTQIIARDIEKRSISEQNVLKTLATFNADSAARKVGSSTIFKAPKINSNTAGFPLTGSPRSLVILVNFSDLSFVVQNPNQAFSNLLNQTAYADNGGTGSARDYFRASSYGKFAPQFDVVGPYTLPKSVTYYGQNNSRGDDLYPQEMVVEACRLANEAGVNFAQYDTDNNGYVDNVFVYYAGYNEAEGAPTTTIWPHRWGLANDTAVYDSKIISDYACTSELNSNKGTAMCGIGTFCHEFGHVLGLPDYYHTAENKLTLEEWSIMDYGAYNNKGRTPPTYSTYDRFYLGWLTPQQISATNDYELYPIYQGLTQPSNTVNQSFLLSAQSHNLVGINPNPAEFFMLEYRKKIGWDSFLPSEGMLIWHVDYDQSAWINNRPNNYTGTVQTQASHMRVYLQPLSGSTAATGTAFSSGYFTPSTWSGVPINREIKSIVRQDDKVSFKLISNTPTSANTGVIKVGLVNQQLAFDATYTQQIRKKTLSIRTTDLTGILVLSITGADASLFTASATAIAQEQANATLGAIITISYQPTAVGNHAATLTISGGGLEPARVIELSGVGK